MFKEALPLLRLLYIGFCILETQYYVESVGMHLLLYEFQLSNNHPAVQLQDANWRNMNGEDLELGNRALSHSTKSVRGQSEAKVLHRSYRLLGCMFDQNVNLRSELKKYQSM